MKERTGMAVSVDSGDEEDWDAPVINHKVWGHREGPKRERPVDDLLITVQDLFPCLQPLFETCGCQQRRPKRIQPLRLDRGEAGGPKLETVCLDCGNVLDAKDLPRSVAIDMFDRGTAQHHLAFTHGLEQGEQDSPVTPGNFEGYETWKVMPTAPDAKHRPQYVPLPQFREAPSRIFQNRPLDVSATVSGPRDYQVDHTGRVELPDFQHFE